MLVLRAARPYAIVKSMRTVIAADRPYHSAMLANAALKHSSTVEIYTSAPRRFYRGLDPSIKTRLILSPLQIAAYALKRSIPAVISRLDTALFDALVASRLGPVGLYIGWASEALSTARRAKRQGALYALDRACPHFNFQQALVQQECEVLGVPFHPQPRWWQDRQIEEYELADAILVPSKYTAETFPAHLQSRLVKAPLLGRAADPAAVRQGRNPVFTVGTVGGSPIRKGHLYLLRAWKKLALPNARLLLRSSSNLSQFPALADLLRATPNVEQVDFVPDISSFYQRCDVFALPSIDDGFGMALIEAMLNGRACVTTTHCGASELLADGVEGLVIEPANEDQLAEAILRLYEDEDLREAMGAAARTRAREIAASHLYDHAVESMMHKLEVGRARIAVAG
jgi:glycosyltransferase involved in cell wall biosynthesis